MDRKDIFVNTTKRYECEFVTYIPDNDYGITSRWYRINGIVDLLRRYKYNPEIIHFIADMLEE